MKNKNIIKTLLILIFAIGCASSYADELSDRTILKEKLRFFYIADPNIDSVIELNTNDIFNGKETGPFWSDNNMYSAQALLWALLQDEQNGGDVSLQYFAARVLTIINKPVFVLLYDDTVPLTDTAVSIWRMPLENGKVWPSASNQSNADDQLKEEAKRKGNAVPERFDDRRAGYMHLGASLMDSKGISWARGVFLHELVHTQDLSSDGRLHLFEVNGNDYSYGADESHKLIEAVPDMARAYMEGIANTIVFLYEKRYEGYSANTYFNWFSNNNDLLVEINPKPKGTMPDTSANAEDPWLYDRIIKSGGVEREKVTLESGAVYATFGVRDLEPRFIIHNEAILALIFSEYARHTSFDTFMQVLQEAGNKLFRVSGSGVAVLFETMCTAGLPEGATLESIFQSNTTRPATYLLPLAYADYFTSYNAQTKDDFSAIFENMMPQSWIDLYWDTVRNGIRTAVPKNRASKYSDLTDIALALGINNSKAN